MLTKASDQAATAFRRRTRYAPAPAAKTLQSAKLPGSGTATAWDPRLTAIGPNEVSDNAISFGFAGSRGTNPTVKLSFSNSGASKEKATVMKSLFSFTVEPGAKIPERLIDSPAP